jgi:hypothetical protein
VLYESRCISYGVVVAMATNATVYRQIFPCELCLAKRGRNVLRLQEVRVVTSSWIELTFHVLETAGDDI